MRYSRRDDVVARIADHLAARMLGHPLRVAVDGITASGKTTLAAELASAVRARGRTTIHLSMDDFHHPRAHRYRQGRDSPTGYYEDAFDLTGFARLVLSPLGPDGDRAYCARLLDLEGDVPLDEDPVVAPADAVVVVDGTFLQRPEIADGWDEVVFVDTDFEVARERGAHRDAEMFGGQEQARLALDTRYHAACHLYIDAVDPSARASVVLGNDDTDHPVPRRIGGRADDTVHLFSYGTLRQPEVQTSNFARLLEGVPDTLIGYRSAWVAITDPDVVAASGSDRHPIVRHTGDSGDSVAGTVFTISPVELAAADGYEVDDYRRTLVRLGSGTEAWVYVAVPAPGT